MVEENTSCVLSFHSPVLQRDDIEVEELRSRPYFVVTK